jgi:hypothetical protein
MELTIVFFLGFLIGFGLFVWFLVTRDAMGVYRKSVVTDYLVEQQAHERNQNQILMNRYDTIVQHQNSIIKLQNESPTLLAYLAEIKRSHCETGVNHISQLKSENDNAEKVGLKIKDNGDLLLRKSAHNTLLVSENENYIADLSLLELGEMNNGRLLVQEIPQKVWVVKCEICATYFPTKSPTAVTCGQNCRKQKSLNS